MIDVSEYSPFIVKELAGVAVILGHRKLVARRVRASWIDVLNLQTLHAHHLFHSFPKFFIPSSYFSQVICLHLKRKQMEKTESGRHLFCALGL